MTARTILSPDRLPDKGITLGNDQRKTLEAKGLFPKRVSITERTYGYVEAEIDEYVESRIAARDAATSTDLEIPTFLRREPTGSVTRHPAGGSPLAQVNGVINRE